LPEGEDVGGTVCETTASTFVTATESVVAVARIGSFAMEAAVCMATVRAPLLAASAMALEKAEAVEAGESEGWACSAMKDASMLTEAALV